MARTKTIKATEADSVVEPASETVETAQETNKALKDSDEIEVVSLIPNVSYQDSHTDDLYEWEEVGHSELMPFSVIKNMWRSHKSYFKNLLLEPMDKRVVEQFGLSKVYEKYKMLLDGSNYTRKDINKIVDAISSSPNGLKFSLCNKIKSMIVQGEITDVFVIRTLEKQFDTDLISYIK